MKRLRTLIKICGLTREADVDAAVQAGADYVGFVHYPPSPRHVELDRAAELAARLPDAVTPVLLVVNPQAGLVRAGLARLPRAVVQFHGDETPEQCQTAAQQHAFWRAARMRPGLDLLNFALAFQQAQAILLDAHVEGYGGAGKSFDWSLIPAGVPARLVLSGGLNPANVTDGIHRVRPWAVDVSSGVEVAKGIKDAGLMKDFCEAVRAADARRDD
ncbi:MAG: phosphoribosylanthranilate isomerase [Betaproteobacteria bacterium]|nr:phosphoribosylanthranilate isomerase [Betaproteobacteria bacterium]NBT11499.1 phosphoribosylanthranilate isomerase [Betaproteobacteria bacterium]NBU49868.1 phosphoribosylanthranilate isomerase [Betaproteobacteria bacterium]NBX96902.1 phosphoribosylanthranilate isomerase [Betaproteobacteria bacterium]